MEGFVGEKTLQEYFVKKLFEAKVNEKKKRFYISFFGEIISQCLDVIVLGEMEFLIVSSSGSRYLNSPCNARRVQYVNYMDEIASKIAVKPSLFSLFLWDPKLAGNFPWAVHTLPVLPTRAREVGWSREAILTPEEERIIKPLRTRTLICDQAPWSVPRGLKYLYQPFSSLFSLSSLKDNPPVIIAIL